MSKYKFLKGEIGRILYTLDNFPKGHQSWTGPPEIAKDDGMPCAHQMGIKLGYKDTWMRSCTEIPISRQINNINYLCTRLGNDYSAKMDVKI